MAFRFPVSTLSFLSSSMLTLILLSASLPALADDISNPERTTIAGTMSGTAGDDSITNHGTVGGSINAGTGNDIIINHGSVGGSINAEDGNDTIINHGTVGSGLNGQAENDTITNYGTADDIFGFDGDDIIINRGTINNSIAGQDDDDTITNYGTAKHIYAGNNDDTVTIYGEVTEDVWGEAGTDSLILENGSSVGDEINTFEFITTNGSTTIGSLNLTGLDTMTVNMSSNTAPVINTSISGITGILNVNITDGSFSNGQTVNIFLIGSLPGFGTETVSDSSPILSFTINNAQVTATRVTTFNALVSGATDDRITEIAALFEDKANTATGDLAGVIGKLNFLTVDQLESAFKQMTGLDSNTQAMTKGLRMGSGATMARMDSMLASRSTSRTGLSSLSSFSLDDEKQAQGVENFRFLESVFAMFTTGNSGLTDQDDTLELTSQGLFNSNFTSQNIALPAVGDLGPALDLGTSDTGGAWLRALGGLSHQDNKDEAYGYDGKTYGLAGGMDTIFYDDILAGLFGSWTRMEIDYDDPGSSEAEGKAYQLGAYTAWGPDAWFYEASLAATYGSWDSRRRIASGALDETASSTQDAYGANLAFTMGRNSMAGSLVITPVAGLEYSFSHENGYTETEAGALNQTVASINRQSLRTMAGLQLERPFSFKKENRSFTLAPAIKAQWLHEFLGGEDRDYSFTGMGAITMSSPEPERDTARLGASLTLIQDNGYSGYISYETDITETYIDHTLITGFRMAF